MISVDEALSRITKAFAPLASEWVALANARGRVLAEDLVAPRDQPHQDISAMDGYAVRSADLGSGEAVLTLIGEAPAGGRFEGVVGPGQTVRIFTGGPVPEGADAVALQENARADGKRITLSGQAPVGRFIRQAGLDVKKGAVVLRAGRILDARDLGLAAGLNRVWLKVRRRARIALLATGDELVRPGEPLGADRIVTTNSITLGAMIENWGGSAIDLGIIADRADAFSEILPELGGVDLIVTIGGASVGERDLVRQALGKEGLALDFWKIAMRPGKPLMFGKVGGIPLLGLPGNPVSSAVCAVLFVKAVIRSLQGLDPIPVEVPAVLGTNLGANDERQDYLRATVVWRGDGRLEATPASRQDSAMFALFAHADCLIKRPPFAEKAKVGDAVSVIPLRLPGA
ncbi:MAG: molybdopterin molybdotransferase MoeA [Alphaproteobacteria bacterium]|nr:molybdopterin molybdotransferase MoeA [Alphaproteobacteria bacterium]